MALIPSRRHVLAIFLVLGATAVFATRPFGFKGPEESLEKDVGNFVLHKQTPLKAAVMTAAQYLLLFLAVTNCLLNSIQLGTSTILIWKCLWLYLQFGWNFITLVPRLFAALLFRLSKGQSWQNSLCV